MERVDVAVIGAGVTGLAAARAIASTGRSVCVLERHARPGLETSTHNSGVIHAGIYNPVDALKSSLCIRGRRLLYEFCAAHGVAHRRCGKLIVATSTDERDQLDALFARGVANGVEDLQVLGTAAVRAREPQVHAVAAIFSPATGIVDADGYVRALLGSAERAGAIYLRATPLLGASPDADGVILETGRERILAGQVVNAAGLYADDVSGMVGGEAFTIYPCRGEYAELSAGSRIRVNGLVYPLPHASGHGLGVHLLPTTGGQVWLGPTIRYQARKDDYENDRLPVDAFLEPARRLLPDVTLSDLRLGGSGIRPKLHPASARFADFLIRRDTANPRVVHAAGIESPGLTASLAVGEMVRDIVLDC
jgi:L-2-hydroxyglutarate oxidase LhgO